MTDKQIILSLTRELEAATKPKWVSVSDRLPEHDGVKGCSLGSSVIVDIYADGERWINCYYNFDAEMWFDTDLSMPVDSVTHWQPTPPAPEVK